MNTTPATTKQQSPVNIRMGGHRGGNILEFYPQEFKPEPSPIEIFRQHVIQWFFASKHLRFWENAQLVESPKSNDMATHRMVCSSLITFGEFAANFVRDTNVNLAAVGIDLKAIEAETWMLRQNFRMFHDETMSCAEAEDILKEVFDEAG